MKNRKNVAVIAGATGVAGRTCTEFLAHQPNWDVIAIARNCSSLRELEGSLTLVEADLNDKQVLAKRLSQFEVSHLFYTAWVNPPGGLRDKGQSIIEPMQIQKQMAFAKRWVVPQLSRSRRLHDLFYRGFQRAAGSLDLDQRNLKMLSNVTGVLAQPPHRLKHVALLTGGKFYGMHMGPSIYPGYTTPFTEQTPTHPGHNTYAEMEGYLQEVANGRFSWSVVRPTFIIGPSPKPSQSIGYSLAIYAWLLKALGQPLIFPAGSQAYSAKGHYSSACLLAKMLHWSATDPNGANQTFNLVNGDVVSWEQLWPWLGDYFDMPIEVPADGMSLKTLLKDREQTWDDLRQRYQLPPRPLDSVFSANFLGASLAINWDATYSMAKAEALGFDQTIDTYSMFADLFATLEYKQIIPSKKRV